MDKITNARKGFRNAAAKAGTALTLGMVSLGAFAQEASPVAAVKAKIETAGADGATIAVAVVLALWGITAVYMLRRKG